MGQINYQREDNTLSKKD